MGKKKDGKKKGLGKLKTQEKAAKKDTKREKRAKELRGEKDVQELIAEAVEREQALFRVEEIPRAEPPSPRINFTLVTSPLRDSHLLLYGGEHYDGSVTSFYSQLYRYNLDNETWSLYQSPNQPPPRSAHAAATHRGFMYVFGGEFSSPRQTQFHHYRDLWRLDVATMGWQKIEARAGPTARSGHRMCICRDLLFVFGGFYDTLNHAQYLNDMFYVDLSEDELRWTKVIVPGACPSPRSAFTWASTGDEIVLFGGYSKEVVPHAAAPKKQRKGAAAAAAAAAEGAHEEMMSARGVVHSDVWKLSPDTKRWEKLKASGYGPAGRCNFGAVMFKRQLVVFGGVEDEETEESLQGTFFNDVFAYSVDRRKWYPMTLRRKRAAGRRRRRACSSGTTVTATTTPNAQMDVERAEDPDADAKAAKGCAATEAIASDLKQATIDDNGAVDEDNNDDDDEDEDDEEEVNTDLRPLGRINAGVVLLKGSKLGIYGGMYEKDDREIALDDFWTLDLGKLDAFVCHKPLSKQQLQWVTSDSEDSGSGEDEEENEDEDGPERRRRRTDDDESEEDEDNEKGHGDESNGDEAQTLALQQRRRLNLRKKLDSSGDDAWTPRVGETLKDFFERTKLYWMKEVYEATDEVGKANRRIAFDWSRRRFEQIKPTLRELEELERFFEEEEEAERRHERREAEMRLMARRRA